MPATVCIALGCTSEPCAELEAGLDLRLCTKHLDALRGMCRRKHRMRYAKLAVNEAARIAASPKRKRRPGRVPAAYRCDLCRSWHVGHDLADVDPSVNEHTRGRAAAAAVRSTLTPRQLNLLLEAWRHGRADRPATTTT